MLLQLIIVSYLLVGITTVAAMPGPSSDLDFILDLALDSINQNLPATVNSTDTTNSTDHGNSTNSANQIVRVIGGMGANLQTPDSMDLSQMQGLFPNPMALGETDVASPDTPSTDLLPQFTLEGSTLETDVEEPIKRKKGKKVTRKNARKQGRKVLRKANKKKRAQKNRAAVKRRRAKSANGRGGKGGMAMKFRRMNGRAMKFATNNRKARDNRQKQRQRKQQQQRSNTLRDRMNNNRGDNSNQNRAVSNAEGLGVRQSNLEQSGNQENLSFTRRMIANIEEEIGLDLGSKMFTNKGADTGIIIDGKFEIEEKAVPKNNKNTRLALASDEADS